MVEPISLNKARKVRSKADAKAAASQNRVRFGRTKVEKTRDAALAEKRAREQDGHKRDR